MEQETLNKSKHKTYLLLIIQIILCILILLFTITSKYIFPNLFSYMKNWYIINLNDSILTPAVVEDKYKNDNINNTNNIIEKIYNITKTSSIDDNSNNCFINKKNKTITTPVNGIITSDFGERIDPSTGKKKFHKGIDIAAPKNTCIKCALDGKVIKIDNNSSYGKYIIVEHNDNIKTLYAHCNKIIVNENKFICAGQEIALVGSTGDSTGNHLHFEFIVNDKCINPKLYMNEIDI